MTKVRINTSQLNKAIDEAFASVVAAFDVECIAVIEDPNEFADVGLPDRDLIDTGRLRDSQIVDVQGNKATFTWDPVSPENGYHYAMALLVGFFAYGGTKYVPGRHWAMRALRRIDPVVMLAEELKKQGLDAKVTRNDVQLLD